MVEAIKKHLPAHFILITILLIGSCYLFSDSMGKYPAYVHAWTQSDRLALAMNFQENDFDIFHPATYNLLTKDGITQVDFPIHDYLVAGFSSFLKTDIVSTFRLYTLIYSLIGIFFFFHLVLLFTKSSARSILASVFIFTLPFFVYYQNGFLPSVPSFANFIIGIYLVYKAQSKQSTSYFIWGVLFLTLAALARAPFLIFLVALLIQQVWQQFKQKQWNLIKLLSLSVSILLFGVYYLYNQYLGETYGSMFLAKFLHFKSIGHFMEMMAIALDRWSDQLMSPFHAILLISVLVSVGLGFNAKGFSSKEESSLLQYLLIASAGVLIFFFAFGQQFAEHDYYYLDSFLPLLSLLVVFLISKLEISNIWYTPVATVCGIFFFYFFSYAKQNQENRYTPPYDDRIEFAYSAYKNAKSDLEKWGIKDDDTIYVIEANSTNIPFTIWNKRGYTNLNSNEKYLREELERDFNYAVLLDSFFVRSTFKDYPELMTQLEKVNSNGELSLYKKSKDNRPSDFFDNLIFYGYSDFDSNSNLDNSTTAWTLSEKVDESHQKSLKIQAINEFTLSVKDSLKNIIPDKAIRIHFLADLYQKDSSEIQVVCHLNNYYQTHYTINELKEVNEWESVQFDYKIDPSYFKNGDPISFYFWNPEKDELFVDNVKILIYQ